MFPETLQKIREIHESFAASGGETRTIWGPPGTGKTQTSAEEWLRAESAGLSPVMLTFSRAARDEMESRASSLAQRDWSREKGDSRRFRTLDGIAVAHFIKAGERGSPSDPEGPRKPWNALDIDEGFEAFAEDRAPRLDETHLTARGASHIEIPNFMEWLRLQPTWETKPEVQNLFSNDDNPISPGPFWKLIDKRRQGLKAMDVTDRYSPEQHAQFLWIEYTWSMRAFRFGDCMWYLSMFPKWPLSEIPQAVIVDEAQDLSALQHYALLRLCEQTQVKVLTMVGDPNQSIMSFRGASPRPFTDIYLRSSEDSGSAKFLGTTFRFPQNICEATEYFRQRIMGKKYEQHGAGTVVSQEQGGRIGKDEWGTQKELAHKVCELLENDPGNIFVLFTNRVGNDWRAFMEAVKEIGVPYTHLSGHPPSPAGVLGSELVFRTESMSPLPRGAVLSLEGIPAGCQRAGSAALWSACLMEPSEMFKQQGVPASRAAAVAALTAGVCVSKWWEKTPKKLFPKTENDSLVWNTQKAEYLIPYDDWSRKILAPKYRRFAEEIAVCAADALFSPPISARPNKMKDEQGSPISPARAAEAVGSICRSLREFGKDICLSPDLHIATVHQAKGRECEICFLIPTGPPRKDPSQWEDEMLRVYYVGITRAKKEMIVAVPSLTTDAWALTERASSWRGLNETLQHASSR